VQNVYLYERLLKLDEQERARQQRHAQRLREAGIVDRSPHAWLVAIVALFASLRLG